MLVNGKKTLRLGDRGKHGGCCGSSAWKAAMGWTSVLVNGKPIHCQGDATEHCGGIGALSGGSPNVIVGSIVSAGSGGLSGTIFQLQIDTPMFLQVEIKGLYVSPTQTIESLKAFRHGFEAGLMMLAGQAAQMAAQWGLGRLFRLIDRVWEPLGSALEQVVVLFGDYIPGISAVLRWVRVLVQSIIMNQLLYGWRAQPKHGPCPSRRSVGPPVSVAALKLDATNEQSFATAGANLDVSKHVQVLLKEFRPIFVEDPKDHRALSMEELLENSRLEPLYNGEVSYPKTLADYHAAILKLEDQNPETNFDFDTPDDYLHEALGVLNIDDDFSHYPGLPENDAQRVYYGRAIKCSNTTIVLQYVALRSGSFFPFPFVDDTMWAHEGDGEAVRVIIRRRAETEPWLLAGLLFTGEHYERNCSCGLECEDELPDPDAEEEEKKKELKKLERRTGCIHCDDCEDPFLPDNMVNVACEVDKDTNRPIVYVAIGSHAMGPTSGPRRTVKASIDHYPTLEAKTRIANYDLRTSDQDDVRKTVFTRRVRWGSKANWDDFAPTSPGIHEILESKD